MLKSNKERAEMKESMEYINMTVKDIIYLLTQQGADEKVMSMLKGIEINSRVR